MVPRMALAQQTVDEWQREAVRKFPEIAVKDSPLHQLFLKQLAHAKKARPEIFENPNWPMKLAEEAAIAATMPDPLLLPSPSGVVSPSMPVPKAKETPPSPSVPAVPATDIPAPPGMLVPGDPAAPPTGSSVRQPDATPMPSKEWMIEKPKPIEAPNPLLDVMLQGIRLSDVRLVTEACARFTHKEPVFRANVSAASAEITAANTALEGAMVSRSRTTIETARIRRNANTTDRPNPLFPKDTSNHTRAQAARSQANQLDAQAQMQVQEARDRLRTGFAALEILIQRIRESDAQPSEGNTGGGKAP